ncbi:MAG: DUF6468 domain-containing protein [Pseudomonadota bacterium]
MLILACLTTAIYCFVLSRRLRSLSGLDEGIGLQIKQMNTALEEMRTAIKTTRASAKTASDRLARDVAEARLTAQRLNQLVQDAGSTSAADTKVDQAPSVRPKSAKTPALEPDEDMSGEDSHGGSQADQASRDNPEPDELPDEIAFDDARLSIEPNSDPFAGMANADPEQDTPDALEPDEEPDFDDIGEAKQQSTKLMKVERMAL